MGLASALSRRNGLYIRVVAAAKSGSLTVP